MQGDQPIRVHDEPEVFVHGAGEGAVVQPALFVWMILARCPDPDTSEAPITHALIVCHSGSSCEFQCLPPL